MSPMRRRRASHAAKACLPCGEGVPPPYRGHSADAAKECFALSGALHRCSERVPPPYRGRTSSGLGHAPSQWGKAPAGEEACYWVVRSRQQATKQAHAGQHHSGSQSDDADGDQEGERTPAAFEHWTCPAAKQHPCQPTPDVAFPSVMTLLSAKMGHPKRPACRI